ncbi:hypothetical protein Scep_012895 [Stephania cephalantha]|uniref:Uncharacterized protein n=1 Tax=Stephania cephalantha TaxID=152367 RepID=A0AAP0JI87_9MAGN
MSLVSKIPREIHTIFSKKLNKTTRHASMLSNNKKTYSHECKAIQNPKQQVDNQKT